jgi:hypothetical protein
MLFVPTKVKVLHISSVFVNLLPAIFLPLIRHHYQQLLQGGQRSWCSPATTQST